MPLKLTFKHRDQRKLVRYIYNLAKGKLLLNCASKLKVSEVDVKHMFSTRLRKVCDATSGRLTSSNSVMAK